MRSIAWSAVLVVATAACGGEDNNSPFGVGSASAPGSASASATATPTTTAASSDGSSSGTDAEEPSGTSSPPETSGATTEAETSGTTAPDPTETTGETTLTTGEDTGVGDDGGAGMQPGDGQYSNCSVPEDCGFTPDLCITINDMDGALLSGFCSTTGCANAAVDCDPSPGGTAVPTCMPATVNDVAEMACALDCTGGLTCPAPMQCYNLASGSVCA